ncbi:MAG: hypothetical protein N3A66_11460 [Planctomycetota bacterium]|nr:hypothetical protein [Planctomycetota bacterium]
MRTLRIAVLGFAALALSLLASAGVGPNYRYGEIWWEECEPDKDTELLLHFGPPLVTARKKLTAAVAEKKKEENLGDDLDLEAGPGLKDADLPKVGGDLDAKPAVDEASLPADVIADYSDKRRQIKLGPGFKRVAGRFGQGLRCEGSGKIKK